MTIPPSQQITNQLYCEEKAIPAGSSLYYSLRTVSPTARHALIVLHALYQELDSVRYTCQDISVAHSKMQWWRAEVHNAIKQNATHPVIQSLQELWEVIPSEDIINLVEIMVQSLDITRFPDMDSLQHHCEHQGGALFVLSARILDSQLDEEAQQALKVIGGTWQLAGLFRFLRRDLLQGYVYVGGELLQKHGVTEQELFAFKTTAPLQALFADYLQHIQQSYQQGVEKLPKTAQKAQTPQLILAYLSLMTLLEVKADNYQLLTNKLALTPMHKLWLSWRAEWCLRFGSRQFFTQKLRD